MYEALYIHIPFCKQRCAYCDFVSEAVPGDDGRMDAYLALLVRSIRDATKAGELARVRTLYVGGGTPTHFGHGRLVELVYTLSLSIDLAQVLEFTVEANPESLTSPLVKDLYALGVDRLSLGAQSFVDSELALLGRIHSASRIQEAYQVACERINNISLDLMCGIPGQSPESWQHSLESALALDPEHLSIYPLQLEEDTPLTLAVERGEVSVGDEDAQARLLEQAARELTLRGYKRYEVASYAKSGYESKHNVAYWTGVPYLGLGYGAASMQNLPDGTRQRCVAEAPTGGEQKPEGREAPAGSEQKPEGEALEERTELHSLFNTTEEPAHSPTKKRFEYHTERLSAEERAAEDLMLAMRMSRGVSEDSLTQAQDLLPRAGEVFKELEQLGLVRHCNARYEPTEKGWLLGNELYLRIWDLASLPNASNTP